MVEFRTTLVSNDSVGVTLCDLIFFVFLPSSLDEVFSRWLSMSVLKFTEQKFGDDSVSLMLVT